MPVFYGRKENKHLRQTKSTSRGFYLGITWWFEYEYLHNTAHVSDQFNTSRTKKGLCRSSGKISMTLHYLKNFVFKFKMIFKFQTNTEEQC